MWFSLHFYTKIGNQYVRSVENSQKGFFLYTLLTLFASLPTLLVHFMRFLVYKQQFFIVFSVFLYTKQH